MLNEMVAVLVLLTPISVLGFAAAQASPVDAAQALSLVDVTEIAPELDADVITASADLAAAERELRRTEGDPLALRLSRLEAEQQVASEQADLTSARLAAERDATGLYFDALEADDALDLARGAA